MTHYGGQTFLQYCCWSSSHFLSKEAQIHHDEEMRSLLDLNVSKSKEMEISPKHTDSVPTIILGFSKSWTCVQTYKYLGTVFDDRLRFSDSTDVKKAQQRLCCKLNSFRVDQRVLTTFYSFYWKYLNIFIYLAVYIPLSKGQVLIAMYC